MDQELRDLLNCGFLFIDKPRGPSSHEVSAYVRKLLQIKKTGHAGTLDPNVSGILIIGLNKATRLLRFIAKDKKIYVGVMKVKKPILDLNKVQKIFDKFVGEIKQIPPKESAVSKKLRTRKVYKLKVEEIEDKKILFIAEVEAGTYIRTLCQQIGKYFEKGKMIELRRIKVGQIDETMCINLYELVDAWKICQQKNVCEPIKRLINPCDKIILLPKVLITKETAETICRGLPLAKSGVANVEVSFKKNEFVYIINKETTKIIAIGLSLYSSDEIQKLKDNEKVILPKIVLC